MVRLFFPNRDGSCGKCMNIIIYSWPDLAATTTECGRSGGGVLRNCRDHSTDKSFTTSSYYKQGISSLIILSVASKNSNNSRKPTHLSVIKLSEQ